MQDVLVLRFMLLILDVLYMYIYHPDVQPTGRRDDILRLMADIKKALAPPL